MTPRALALLAVVVAAAALGLTGALDGSGADGDTLSGRVTRVVDGDTVHVDLGGRDETVRYIGVDTPETHHPTKGVQCYGPAASAYNQRLVDAQRVRLTVGAEPRDRYGRLLAYVERERDGLQVNAQLVRTGYARTLTIPPNDARADAYAQLASSARRDHRGLWGAC